MIVPEYWAEAKERVVYKGKASTYLRFGWSDESQEDAFENARERVLEVAERAGRGEQIRLVDHKVAYNGAEGLPIREQVVERHGNTVITRNAYGAICLNTPNVLFADIDVQEHSSAALAYFFFGLGLAATFGMYIFNGAGWLVIIPALAGAVFCSPLSRVVTRLLSGGKDRAFEKALQRVEEFARENPDWSIRVYRTPNGYRLLVVHQLFDINDETAFRFLSAVGSDKLYIQMCRNQKCFRARLTPKPWRLELPHIKPRPGVWPIKEGRMAERSEWIEEYNAASRGYAACHYEKTLGSGRKDPDCEWVRQIHDEQCRARQDLPLA